MLFASSSPADCVRFGEKRNSSLMFMTSHYEKPAEAVGKAKCISAAAASFRPILLSSTF